MSHVRIEHQVTSTVTRKGAHRYPCEGKLNAMQLWQADLSTQFCYCTPWEERTHCCITLRAEQLAVLTPETQVNAI